MIRLSKKLTIFLMSVAVMATLFGLLPRGTSAETVVTTDAKEGLQISPVIVELDTSKGGSYNVNIQLTNVTTEDHIYYSAVNDFTAKDETGTPSVQFENLLPDTASIRNWVVAPSQVQVKSGQAVTIQAQVNVPLNAEAGGHYGTLRFSGVAPKPQVAGVGLAASTGMLFLIRVDGNIAEKASVASFYATPTAGDKESSLFEKAPITIVARIKNDGNVHLKPTGQIQVHDMFGGLVTTLKVNESMANVLPDSIRRFDSTLSSSWLFGRYTADLALGYGIHGQALTQTISFWVIPYKIILVIAATIITLIFILVRIVKVYNKRIITKAIQKHDQKNTNTHSKK
jgi:hypothetical protein